MTDPTFLTPEQYLEIERKAAHKSEYRQGQMFGKEAASEQHGLIVTNIAAELRQQLKGRPCRVIANDLRIHVQPSGLYTYPDVLVVCGESQHADDHKDVLLNPIVIVEVASDSTRDYDRGQKFKWYRTLPSLQEYLTVAHDVPHVEQWTRLEKNLGRLTDFNGLSKTIHLTSIDCVLPLAEVYDKVDWTHV